MGRLSEVITSASKPVTGTALIPTHQYPQNVPIQGLSGRRCVCLGREKGGVYKNKLNFFGGKVNYGEPPVEALIHEVAEEMYIKLTLKVLNQCVVDAQLVAYQSKKRGNESYTLLVFVHITGISCKAWKDVKARMRRHASGSLLEMSQVLHVPVDEIGTRHDLSSYVTETVSSINQAMQLLSGVNAVSFTDLPRVLFPEVFFKSRRSTTEASEDSDTDSDPLARLEGEIHDDFCFEMGLN